MGRDGSCGIKVVSPRHQVDPIGVGDDDCIVASPAHGLDDCSTVPIRIQSVFVETFGGERFHKDESSLGSWVDTGNTLNGKIVLENILRQAVTYAFLDSL